MTYRSQKKKKKHSLTLAYESVKSFHDTKNCHEGKNLP